MMCEYLTLIQFIPGEFNQKGFAKEVLDIAESHRGVLKMIQNQI